MDPARRQLLVGLACGVSAAAGFSLKAVLAKLVYREPVDATTLLTLRMGYALPFYLVMLAWSQRAAASPTPLPRARLVRVAGVGVLGYYLASYFDFEGLARIGAGLERLVLYLYPTLVLGLGRLVYGRPITGRAVLAAGIAYAGLGVAVASDLTARGDVHATAVGTGLVFLSALTYAGYVLFSGELLASVGTSRFTALAMLAATVPMLVTFLLRHEPAHLLSLSPRTHGLAITMAVFATVVPSWLMSAGIARLGSSSAALVGSLGPILTVGLEAALLGERVTPASLLGMTLVIAGVLYGTLAPKPPETR